VRTVHGVNPVRELLRAAGDAPSEIWVVEGAERQRLAEILRLARERGARVREAPRQKLDRLAGDSHHQGVVAVVGDYRYREVEDILAVARARGEPALVVVLDGIEDPHNLGAIIRSAHALGGHGVVIPQDRAVGVTSVAAKASAGAVEHCPVARVVNISKSLEMLKDAGVWAVALAGEGEAPISSMDLRGPTALVVGSEGKGVRPLVRKTCDHVASIPMAGEVGSLNASAAASIALYEAVRQRRSRSGENGGDSRT
jgi:23S rRNA (guanosine2251-2'-O)-methyltransferase